MRRHSLPGLRLPRPVATRRQLDLWFDRAIAAGPAAEAFGDSAPRQTRPLNCASPLCALPQEAGDHRPTVFLEALVADAMCPDNGAEALPQRLDREQFGILTLNCPAAAML